MSWSYCVLGDGREAGYGVDAICDEKDCGEEIDRGLDYLCGETPGGDEYGCGGYFCGKHLYGASLCGRCIDREVPRDVDA